MSEECKWGLLDCLNKDKCYLCSSDGFHYFFRKPKTQSAPRPKETKRKGSGFECQNSINNNSLLSGTTSRMTPNSGAGRVKGDEEICGIINIMEELKEQNHVTTKGEKTFSINKEWLLKLRREANEARKEFWYLKFIFGQHDNDVFIILDEEVIMSMVYTMVSDRKAKIESDITIEVAENRRRLVEAENTKLLAEIEYLKSLLKQEEHRK